MEINENEKEKKKKKLMLDANDHVVCVILYKKIVTYCKFYYKRLTN